jgi:hypothetical protein
VEVDLLSPIAVDDGDRLSEDRPVWRLALVGAEE